MIFDRSFITAIAGDRQDQAIVKAIIDLAKSLEIPIVAEGVETWGQGQLLLLKALIATCGCE